MHSAELIVFRLSQRRLHERKSRRGRSSNCEWRFHNDLAPGLDRISPRAQLRPDFLRPAMHFPFFLETGYAFPLRVALFLAEAGSGADSSSMLCVPWLGGGSKNRRGSTDSCVSIVRGQASHLLHLLILKGAWRAPIKRVSCWHISDVTAGL